MFKWLCLAVAILGLAALGWMINDMRLQMQELTQNVNKQLSEAKTLAGSADSNLTQQVKHLKEIEKLLDAVRKRMGGY